MHQDSRGFTIVEMMIVVVILGIMAMIVVPKFGASADESRESALAVDFSSACRQIELYKHQHGNRGPEINESGARDTANFINRMIGRTTSEGKLDPTGRFGPYLMEWPTNPFVDGAAASQIKFGQNALPARDGTTGWYYSWALRKLYINSLQGGADLSSP